MKNFLFKDRDGQTPLPPELQKGLIPKNIQTIGDLDEYEEENITEGLLWLARYSKDHLSPAFWLKLHRELFKKVWIWAGQIRSHEVNHPDFNMPYQIRPNLKQLEGDIQFWFENKSFSDKEIAARFHERIETIHPFANGNGRFGRILTEYICERQKMEVPTWGKSLRDDPKQRRKKYIDSLEYARRDKNYPPLTNFMFS